MHALIWTRILVTLLVLGHLYVAAAHGAAHDSLAVGLSPLQNAFVYVVILALPLLGAAAAWSRRTIPALWVVAASLAGAAVFGVYHHYILVSPDNIAHLPEGPQEAHEAFISTAAYLALVELVGSGVVLYLCGYWTARGVGTAPASAAAPQSAPG